MGKLDTCNFSWDANLPTDINELNRQYQCLRSVINEVPDPILVVGTDFKVKFANKAARTFSSEFVWEEVKEPFCHNLIYNSSCQCSNIGRPCPLIEVLETHKPMTVEHDVALPSGEIRSYEVHASPLLDESGNFFGIVESLRDITERKSCASILQNGNEELERQVKLRTDDLVRSNDFLKKEITGRQRVEKILRSERDKFQVMLEAMGQGVHIVNKEYIIEYQNEVLRELYGDKIGHNCYEVYKKRSEPCEVCKMHKAIATGKVQQTEELLKDDRTYLQSYAPFNDLDGEDKCLILLADITGQLASIGELAAGVAHEINNPVNGMINFAQLLLDEADDPVSLNLLQRIIDEGDRVATIVSKLLCFSRTKQTGGEHSIEVDVREVMNDSIALLQNQYKKEDIVISISLPADLPLVRLDPQQLEQVFVNILSNGWHALKEKYKERHPDKKLEVKYEEVEINNRPYIRTIITDYGCGIPEELLESVRNAFFTTKQSGEGTGLGLAISERIIKGFDGYLRIKSEFGSYTTVMIDLPKLEREEEESK